MHPLDLFSALQSSTEGIDTEFKSARDGLPGAAQTLRQVTLARAFT